MTLTATFEPKIVNVEISGVALSVGTETPVVRELVERDPYEGDYTVTPGDSEIVLETRHLRMTDNVTIKAVPSGYGKITWNGAYLTVS